MKDDAKALAQAIMARRAPKESPIDEFDELDNSLDGSGLADELDSYELEEAAPEVDEKAERLRRVLAKIRLKSH